MMKYITFLFNKNEIEINKLDAKGRNKNIIKQISSTFFIKIFSVLVTFLSIRYIFLSLGNEKYGIWSILISIMQWISLFDIGIGNGLKNKFSESLSKNNKEEAAEYVSTAYFSMAALAAFLITVLTPAIFLIKWFKIFNSTILVQKDFVILMLFFTYSIIIYFVLALINSILYSLQRSSLVGILPLLINGSFLLVLMIFSNFLKGNIIMISLLYAICLLLSGIAMNLFVFNQYKYLKPSLKRFKRKKIESILSIGINFFIIQVASIVMFYTDNIVISQVLGPNFVTKYTITLSFFNYLTAFTVILMVPIWSSYTEAYTKGDFIWMRWAIKRMIFLMVPIFAIGIFMVVFFNTITNIWLGKSLEITFSLVIMIAIYVLIVIWNNIFSFVVGAISKIRLGTIVTVITAAINIPLSIYFSRNLNMGLNGIVLSNIICLLFHSISTPIQVYYFIFSKKVYPRLERLLR